MASKRGATTKAERGGEIIGDILLDTNGNPSALPPRDAP
jgi:hypothetical protein